MVDVVVELVEGLILRLVQQIRPRKAQREALAEALLDESGGLPASEAALARELQRGWLERVWAGDPASGA